MARWNELSPEAAAVAILPCCGSHAWASGVTARRPLPSIADLLHASALVWRGLTERDWNDAFRNHPRIGEWHAAADVNVRSLAWSAQEQSSVGPAADTLAQANAAYEQRFGRVFLMCASGKSSSEILQQLAIRMHNEPATELQVAAEEQCKITDLRLQRWLLEGML